MLLIVGTGVGFDGSAGFVCCLAGLMGRSWGGVLAGRRCCEVCISVSSAPRSLVNFM